MSRLKINMILPFPATKPVGGAKIMYEYANRLSERGHDVKIYHSIKRPFKKSKTPLWYKMMIFKIRGVSRPAWFPLSGNISSVIVPSITNKFIRDADIVISTWWQMVYAVAELDPSKGKKFNLIQDYEVWGGNESAVIESYKLPVYHLVIAKYLQELVHTHSGISPIHIPNAIDREKFYDETEPEKRNASSIVMLYSEEPRKGTRTGLDALKEVKKIIPGLQVKMFGVYKDPGDLPEWISYTRRPANLREIYNSSAVFFSPSNGEGWALPPAEAMACGCAVVCTDIGGHKDYAVHGSTALLVSAGNVKDMADKLIKVITDHELRHEIAANGIKLIRDSFSWNMSVEKLENSFIERLKN